MSDVKEALKIINSNIRKAQNFMFSRKYAEASELAEKIEESLESVKAKEPENMQAKTYTSHLNKLKKDLSAKMGTADHLKMPITSPKAGSEASNNDIKDILKTINTDLRKAQSSMFSRKFEEASSMADNIEKALAEVLSKDSENTQAKTYSNQLDKLRRDLSAKTGKTVSSAPSQSGVPKAEKTSRLPGGVAKRLRDIKEYIKKRDLVYAKQSMKEIIDGYSGQFDENDEEYQNITRDLKDLEKIINEESEEKEELKKKKEESRVRREEQSGEWIAKFKGLKPFSFNTDNIEDLLAQEETYDKAKILFDEYRNTDFPFGKTEILESLENEMKKNIEKFPEIAGEIRKRHYDKVHKHLQDRIDSLDKVFEGKVSIMSEGSIKQSSDLLNSVFPLFSNESEEKRTLQELFEKMKAKNNENKKLRANQTFMKENKYNGDDRDNIIERAVRFIKKADPEVEIIKSIVYPEGWKEIASWEPYENTQRFVTRREIYSQIACIIKSCPKLYSIYLTQEKQSDNSWSPLEGNIMFIEDIALENIK